MTIREKLADWLTGGALTRARRENRDIKIKYVGMYAEEAAFAASLSRRINEIAAATANINHGTAKKVHRMATTTD